MTRLTGIFIAVPKFTVCCTQIQDSCYSRNTNGIAIGSREIVNIPNFKITAMIPLPSFCCPNLMTCAASLQKGFTWCAATFCTGTALEQCMTVSQHHFIIAHKRQTMLPSEMCVICSASELSNDRQNKSRPELEKV